MIQKASLDTNSDNYTVVVNHEEQYSIWQVGKSLPHGWEEVGFVGSREECLNYIEVNWIDMRPLSLRSNKVTKS